MRGRALTAAVVSGAAVGAGAMAVRRAAARWDETPDAHGGIGPRFPATSEQVIVADDGAEIRVVEAGQGPTVVLVHGLTSNSDDWGYVAERLAGGGCHVIGVNQRGHGGSTVGHEGFGAPRLGRDLATVFEQMEIVDAVLAGHSMGGIASMSMAIDHPELVRHRVRSLVLVATIARTTRADQRAGIRLISVRRADHIDAESTTARFIARGLFGATPSAAMIHSAIESGARCPEDTRIGASLGLVDYDIRERLASITLPTTVICGTRDLVTPLFENRAIAEAIPGAIMEVVPDAGHLVIWEHDQLVADLIAEQAATVDLR